MKKRWWKLQSNARSYEFDYNGSPKVNEATKKDKDNYLEIRSKTGALYKIDKNGKVMIKAPRSDKYIKIIKPLREEQKLQRQE